MKFFIFPSIFVLLFSSVISGKGLFKNNFQNYLDTPRINHVLDGSISEWPASKFQQDNSTKIKYALDNDADNLYIAMIVPDFRIQMKLMRQGMELYVDVKGKKREEKGIAFPVQKSSGFSNANFSDNNNQNGDKQKPDMHQIRSMMALNLLSLRLIGFSDDNPKDQELILPGSVNIQYTWDDKNIMYIEYSIPMNIFSSSSLSQKTIGLGWKLNGTDASTSNSTPTSSTLVGVARDGSVVSSRRVPNNSNNITTLSNSPSPDDTRDQSFWTKYMVLIPSK